MALHRKFAALAFAGAVGVTGLVAPTANAQVSPAVTSSAPVCLLAAAAIPAAVLSSQGVIPNPFADAAGHVDAWAKGSNNSLQHGLGIHNEQAAAWAQQSSVQAAGVAQQVGPFIGGSVALGVLSSECLPAQPDDDEGEGGGS